MIADGRLFLGVASVAKEPGFRGSVVAVDPETGDVAWQTFTVPEGADGGGVFGAPVVDVQRGLVIVGTQNAYTEPAAGADPGDAMRTKIAAINLQLAKLAAAQPERITFLDLGSKFLAADGTLPADVMPDKLHLSEKGYAIWSDAIEGELKKLMGESR